MGVGWGSGRGDSLILINFMGTSHNKGILDIWNRKQGEYGFGEHGSNTELSEFFGPRRVPGENSASSSEPVICVPKRELPSSSQKLTEFSADSLSSPSILPMSYGRWVSENSTNQLY